MSTTVQLSTPIYTDLQRYNNFTALQTDRQTDRQTDDTMMSIAGVIYCVQQYDQLKNEPTK